jgi:hypothetical protein
MGGGGRGEWVEGGTKRSFDLSLLYTVSDPFFNPTYNKMYQCQGYFLWTYKFYISSI